MALTLTYDPPVNPAANVTDGDWETAAAFVGSRQDLTNHVTGTFDTPTAVEALQWKIGVPSDPGTYTHVEWREQILVDGVPYWDSGLHITPYGDFLSRGVQERAIGQTVTTLELIVSALGWTDPDLPRGELALDLYGFQTAAYSPPAEPDPVLARIAATGPYFIGTPAILDGSDSQDPNPGGSITDYAWSWSGGSATGSTASVTLTDHAALTVTLSVTGSVGGTGSAEIILQATNRAPVAVATADPTTLLRDLGSDPQAVDFDASGSSDPDGDALSYLWNFGDGTTSTEATPSHGYALPGTYPVTLTVTDPEGARATDTVTVTVLNRAPTAVITGPSSGTVGTPYTFSASGSSDPEGDALDYRWIFPDGSTAVTREATHAFTASGAVRLLVTDRYGGSDLAALDFTVVNRAPTAQANGPYSGVAGQPLHLTSFGSTDPDGGGLTYLWDFGDGTTSTAASPWHVFAASGEYAVTLTVTDAQGASGSDVAVATVSGLPETPVDPSDPVDLPVLGTDPARTSTFSPRLPDYLPRWMDLYYEAGAVLRRWFDSQAPPIYGAAAAIRRLGRSLTRDAVPELPRQVWVLRTSRNPGEEIRGLLRRASDTLVLRRVASAAALLEAAEPVFTVDAGGLVLLRNLQFRETDGIEPSGGVYTLPTPPAPETDLYYRAAESSGAWHRLPCDAPEVSGATLTLATTGALQFRYQDSTQTAFWVQLDDQDPQVPTPWDLWNGEDETALLVGLSRFSGETNGALHERARSVYRAPGGAPRPRLLAGVGRELGLVELLTWDGISTLALPHADVTDLRVAGVPRIGVLSEALQPQADRQRYRASYGDWIEGYEVTVNDLLDGTASVSGFWVTFPTPVTGEVRAAYQFPRYTLVRNASGYITEVQSSGNLPSGSYELILVRQVQAWALTDPDLEGELLTAAGLPTTFFLEIARSLQATVPLALGQGRWNQAYWFHPQETRPETHRLPAPFDAGEAS